MRNLLLSAGVIASLLLSCETEKEEMVVAAKTDTAKLVNVVTNTNTTSDSLVTTTATNYLLLTNKEKFNIIFSQDFNNDKTGSYLESEWKGDFNNPSWANHNLGYGNIVSSGTNKYLAHNFPAGAYAPAKGYQWHAKFGKGYDELYFSYRIKFSSGFSSTSLHGKLPGLSGGTSNSGGYLPSGTDGWSARYMYHGTSMFFYLYYPEMYKLAGDAAPVAGKSYYGRGPFLLPGYTMKPEVWYTVTQRIVMNTPGKANGLVEGYINGKLCAVLTGLRFRNISTLQIDRVFFANFFGSSSTAPTKPESICFDDLFVYTYASGVNIARGNVSNPAGTTIFVPVMQ